jgi:hypothetical protein
MLSFEHRILQPIPHSTSGETQPSVFRESAPFIVTTTV